MLDENMQDFHRRLARVSGAHGRGGFAQGADRRRRGVFGLRPLLLILIAVVSFKAAMLLRIGGEDYEDRLAVMRSGELPGQIGATLLSIDPVTAKVAVWMRALVGWNAGA